MNINQSLAALYQTHWTDLCGSLDENGLYDYSYNPLLLHIDNIDDFNCADIRVMLFGQDMSQGDWYKYERNDDVLSKCMPALTTFDNKLGAISHGIRQKRGMGGGMNLFIDILNSKMPQKQIRYVWNDIVKLGRNIKYNDKGRILIDIEKRVFDVIKKEVDIVRPHVIVFFTGPSLFWEQKLQDKFSLSNNDYHVLDGWPNIRQAAQLSLDTLSFPSVKIAFRLSHPCARKIKRRDLYIIVAERIVSSLNIKD